MKIRATLDVIFKDSDFYDQDDLDNMIDSGEPLTFEEFKSLLIECCYDDPDLLVSDLKFEKINAV